MPVYASPPVFADRRRHPRALFLIAGAHALAIAAVMTARMDLPVPFDPQRTLVELIPVPEPPAPPPEPQPPVPKQDPRPSDSAIDRPAPIVPLPANDGPAVDPTPIPLPDPGPVIGANPNPVPIPAPTPAVVGTGPRFATPDWALRPPYPEEKRRLEEEAVLRLRLSIDERGRVVMVEPVGRADRSFLEAARRHLIAHWRYRPATEDGRPVASSTVITLRFELE